ncbi:hypothetical protein IH979_03045, partial [Patescibacteria group bacterium]|nr:hypothetical protein [Patescibacteria group bacterium]
MSTFDLGPMPDGRDPEWKLEVNGEKIVVEEATPQLFGEVAAASIPVGWGRSEQEGSELGDGSAHLAPRLPKWG